MYHRTGRHRFYHGNDCEFQGGKAERDSQNLWIFPQHDFSSVSGLDLEYDLSQPVRNHQLVLRVIGRPDLCKVWLNEPKLVMLLVSIPLIWQYIGYYMVIILSAISSIDTEVFESAEIDGANGVQKAWYITLPLIKNTMLVCITLCVAGNMKAFDNIFVMTKGGPGTASMVMAMYGYQISFNQSNMGYGSCISVGIFVLAMLVIGGSQLLANLFTREKEA